MDVENKGIAYFEELLSHTVDPEGRSMVESLRREEEEHLRIITEKLAGLQK